MAELTGRHVAIITVSAFAVIIAVNVLMAYKAISTFPGLEVANSYVASQVFDAERDAQEALGWRLDTGYDAEAGELRLSFTDAKGLPAQLTDLSVLVGRTTEAQNDVSPEILRRGDGYAAQLSLRPGKWMMRVEAKALDGTPFRQRIDLYVRG